MAQAASLWAGGHWRPRAAIFLWPIDGTGDIGDEVVTTASDALATVEIKAKCAADATLSVWSISAGCTQGHAALSGTVASPDGIGKAIALALDTGGVRDVTSTLEVKPKP